MSAPVHVDVLSLGVFANLFSSIAEEMGVTLQRASYSPNIKMRRDYSCALFDSGGHLLAQAAHMPVHLGAMPMAMHVVRERFTLGSGDVVVMNDPYAGGTHLPDISLVSAACAEDGAVLGYVMSRAHHADIGGMSPGSMPLSTEIYQEGIIIPPLLLVREGQLQTDLLELILRNVRTPEERRGDFLAQLSAQRVGEYGLAALSSRYGLDVVLAHGAALQDYAESAVRNLIEQMQPGSYEFTDLMDNDGHSPERVPISVRIRKERGSSYLDLDFTGSATQQLGSINAVRAVTVSACLYVVRCLIAENVPVNAGSMRPLHITVPDGTVVSAQSPAAVAAGNVETSQRIVDVLFGAFARALPERTPAASQGTMNNITFGGPVGRHAQPFAYYETMGGGAGGRPGVDGAHGVHDHMSNTLNTPVEALESEYPVRVVRYQLRRGSGGTGLHPGGNGLRRDLQFLSNATVTLLTERRETAPYGLAGGMAGAPGENVLIRGDQEHRLASKVSLRVEPGDILSIRTPGGGGWGRLP